MTSAWKKCFKWKEKKKLKLTAEQDLDKAGGSESSKLTSGSPCPEQTSPTVSICSREDIRDLTKALSLWNWRKIWRIRTVHQRPKKFPHLCPAVAYLNQQSILNHLDLCCHGGRPCVKHRLNTRTLRIGYLCWKESSRY